MFIIGRHTQVDLVKAATSCSGPRRSGRRCAEMTAAVLDAFLANVVGVGYAATSACLFVAYGLAVPDSISIALGVGLAFCRLVLHPRYRADRRPADDQHPRSAYGLAGSVIGLRTSCERSGT